MKNIIDKLPDIDPSKKCLEFLRKRVLLDNYRGLHLSQHYRYDMNDVIIILQELYNIAEYNKLRIRTTDITKRPSSLPEEKDYTILVSNIRKKAEKIAQDSLRKIIFVDMHRMGLIYRYNKKGKMVDPYKKGPKYYVSITDIGHKLCVSKSIFEQYNLYTGGINILLKNLPTRLLSIMEAHKFLHEDEFMFFVTFIGENVNDHIYTEIEIIEFIREYRGLSKAQKAEVNRIVAEYCNPKNFSGDKIEKRDFHNWKNETQTIFNLLTQTIYYEFDRKTKKLILRKDKNLLFDDTNKLKRSLQEKNKYFSQHDVKKSNGFELHHVVPLCFAKSKEEYKIYDNWKNMIYIDAFTHSKITQQHNSHVALNFDKDDVTLSIIADKADKIVCKKDDNIKYKIEKQPVMKNYNNSLILSKNK